MITPSFMRGGSRRTDQQSLLEMASEAHEGASFACRVLREFDIARLEFDDGSRGVFLVANWVPGDASNVKDFTVSNISTDDGLMVRVAPGNFTAPDVDGITSAPPTLKALMKEFPVAGGDFDVQDSSFVYLKLTVSKTTVERDPTSEGGGLAAILNVSGEFKLDVWHMTAGEIVVETDVQQNTQTTNFIKLASITVEDGALRIRQHRDGAIDTPTVSSFRATLAIEGNTAEFTVCDDGLPTTREFLCSPEE